MKMLCSLKGRVHIVLSSVASHCGGSWYWGIIVFLEKITGPRSVTLPDGSTLSLADMPKPQTRRWVASRKAAVVRGVAYGLLSQSEAEDRYELSEEEFAEWVRAVSEHGEAALRVTTLQNYRQP